MSTRVVAHRLVDPLISAIGGRLTTTHSKIAVSSGSPVALCANCVPEFTDFDSSERCTKILLSGTVN